MASCEECGEQGWPPEFLNEVFGELPGCPACQDWAGMTSPETETVSGGLEAGRSGARPAAHEL